jgi:hypothetical protein
VYDRVSKNFTAFDMFSNYVALLELGHDGLHDTEPWKRTMHSAGTHVHLIGEAGDYILPMR